MALPPHLKKLQETQSSVSTQASSVNKENWNPPHLRDRSVESTINERTLVDGYDEENKWTPPHPRTRNSESASSKHGVVNGNGENGPNTSFVQHALANKDRSRPPLSFASVPATQRQQLPHQDSGTPGDSFGRSSINGGQRSATSSAATDGMTVREAFGLKQQLDAANARCEELKSDLEVANMRSEVKDFQVKDLEAQIASITRRCDAFAARTKQLEAEKITLVEAAGARADAYEARIKEFEAEKNVLREAATSSTVASSQSPQRARGRSSTRRTPNLTGYESSDEENSDGEVSHARGQEIVIREPSAGAVASSGGSEQLQIMHEILGKLKEKVEEFEKEQANIKSAVQEAQQLGLNDRLKRLESLAADEDHDVNKAMQAWKVTVDADLERLSNVFPPEAPNADLANRLDEHLQRLALRDRQEAHIDEAIYKDMLHTYYQQLSTAIDNDDNRAGSFEGSTDELWRLRDRCVRRLATFDDCAEASNEARKRWEYNGRRA